MAGTVTNVTMVLAVADGNLKKQYKSIEFNVKLAVNEPDNGCTKSGQNTREQKMSNVSHAILKKWGNYFFKLL